MDNTSVRPTLNKLLVDYLEYDIENLVPKLEKPLVDCLYFDSIKDGLMRNVKESAQDNLLNERNRQFFIYSAIKAITG